ncbi:MAG TPA: AAA family ATPase, partial [Candidatus Limnocylindrales bacterium]
MTDEIAVRQGTRLHRTDTAIDLQILPYVPRVAVAWLAEDPARRHRRIAGSLLFADISGFTRLSERLAAGGRSGAEEVTLIVGRVMTALVDEIEERGGDVLLFAGDALVVLFDGAQAPARAVRTAAAIRQWFAESGSVSTSVGRVMLRVSIGVASGPVDLVLAGDVQRAVFVTGPTTSSMVAMERAAEAGEILVDGPTATALDPTWLGEAKGPGMLVRRTRPIDWQPADVPPMPSVDLLPLIPIPLRQFVTASTGARQLEAEHRLAAVAFVLVGGLDIRFGPRGPGQPDPDPAVVGAAADDLHDLVNVACVAAVNNGVTLLGTDVTHDGVVLFMTAGAPMATGEDEERLLRTLREMLTSPVASRLRLRAGVNCGPVFAGDLGAPRRRTYTTMGDTTNLAARIAARAAPGELLASAEVLANSATEFASHPVTPFTPKGKRASITPYAVTDPIRRQARTAGRLPLAGRVREMTMLHDALAAASSGTGGLVDIVGEPGVGKSRLVHELLDDPSVTRLIIPFTPADAATPYGALRPALRGLAQIPSSADADEAGKRLADWVSRSAPGSAPLLPLIAIPFGATVASTPEVDGISPRFRRDRLHDAVGELLGILLAPPAIIVLEDVQWADEATLALVDALLDLPAASHWLFCVLRRPGPDSFPGRATSRIDLAGLEPPELASLAVSAAGDAPLSDAALGAIVSRAAGNPLFARELVGASVDQRGGEALPEGLEVLLASRIDRLDARGRSLLRRAAVLGRDVDLEVLAEALADDDDDVRDPARWAALDEFVAWDGPSRLQFRNDLIRDAAYEGLSHASRVQLHGRVAKVMERLAGEETDEIAAVLAVHFAQGRLPLSAFRYARRAGDRARLEYANVDAAALYRRALESASSSAEIASREVGEVAEALGDVAELAGRYEESSSAYARARAVVRMGPAEVGSTSQANLDLARIARKSGIVCERLGRYGQALTWYARGRRELDANGSPAPPDPAAEALRIRLALDVAGIRFRQGRYAVCVREALPAAEAAQRAGERELLAHAWYLLHAAYGVLGSPEAARYRDLPLPIYEELGDLVGQGNVLNNLGIDAYFEGRWDDALDLYGRSKAAKERAGDVSNAATQSNNEAEILSDQGHLGEARTLLANAYYLLHAAYGDLGSPEVARYRDLALPIYEELGDLVGQGNVLNNLG